VLVWWKPKKPATPSPHSVNRMWRIVCGQAESNVLEQLLAKSIDHKGQCFDNNILSERLSERSTWPRELPLPRANGVLAHFKPVAHELREDTQSVSFPKPQCIQVLLSIYAKRIEHKSPNINKE
jgi:hypothetical protein